MDNDLPSSEIREILYNSDSDNDSDISVNVFPPDVSLEDYSSGSDDDYVPESHNSSSTSDNEFEEPNPRPNRNEENTGATVDPATQSVWLRILPPEPENDVAEQFQNPQSHGGETGGPVASMAFAPVCEEVARVIHLKI
ncbi:hypothetical protein J6590_046640 [Homalodisca vitripennis]|nr:hypothetical protein J6590_046640 [Homalodisca vitripennis]